MAKKGAKGFKLKSAQKLAQMQKNSRGACLNLQNLNENSILAAQENSRGVNSGFGQNQENASKNGFGKVAPPPPLKQRKLHKLRKAHILRTPRKLILTQTALAKSR